MKKNVIALAVAAAVAAPVAMAEVSVSGGLQAEITSWGGDATNGLTMNDAQEGGTPDKGNFGYINFSASEDLGNGMKAVAKYGLNVTTGARSKGGMEGTWTNTASSVVTNVTTWTWGGPNSSSRLNLGNDITVRDAYVGLSGSFGTVLAGRMSSPYKMATVKWDPFLATSAQARGNGGASSLHNGYVDNAIAYANKFGMAQVAVAYVLDEETMYVGQKLNSPDYRNENHMSASVNMPVGPVEVALGYHSNGVADATATKVGVKYAAGAMGVAFTYEALEAGVAGTYGSTDNTVMLLSGTYAMGANTFALNYGMTDSDKNATVAATSPWAKANTITNMSVGMVHGFSKSTSAHVAYTSIDNDNANTTATGIAAGLRVKF